MTEILIAIWSFLAGYAVRSLVQRYRDVKLGKAILFLRKLTGEDNG